MNAPIALASLVGAGLPRHPAGPTPPGREAPRAVAAEGMAKPPMEVEIGAAAHASRSMGRSCSSECTPALSRPHTSGGTSVMTLPGAGPRDQARPRRDALRGEPNQRPKPMADG